MKVKQTFHRHLLYNIDSKYLITVICNKIFNKLNNMQMIIICN
jgi:hypothetical protein